MTIKAKSKAMLVRLFGAVEAEDGAAAGEEAEAVAGVGEG